MMTHAKNLSDAALGCLLGACVGDAAGATLEFLGRRPSASEVEEAIRMPGGGVWDVAPGQITDDGELLLCLTHALAEHASFRIEAIARNYAAWMHSAPFDCGGTISQGFGCTSDPEFQTICDSHGYAEAMTQAAARYSMPSKANGSLMRIAPLGVWGHRRGDSALARFAQRDSQLSHPNQSCCQAVACYVLAIAGFMEHLGDRERAFQRAFDWATSHANQEVRSWLQDAQQNRDIPYHPQAGFVKIAFTHAFRHLLLGTSYGEAIRETLLGGGDTDTNACIVGGLIGAACGADAIPDEMTYPVLCCDTSQGAHPRPHWLQTTQLPELTERLLAG